MKHPRASVVAVPLVDLSPHFEGYRDPVSFGVDQSGAIYAAASRSDEPLVERSGAGTFPKSRRARPSEIKVVRWAPDGTVSTVSVCDDLVASYVQPYPDGVLLVGARCRWTPENVERNGLAVDWDGNELARFTLGDGIEDVRTTPDGRTIWVSYFDEGVFGNYGWSHPGPPAIGSAGLVAFSMDGSVQRTYDPEAAGTAQICDAYAVNVVADGEVWVYFYTEFPLVRVDPRGYQTWRLGIGGASALAVKGRRVLLFGDYDEKNLARIIELGRDGGARVVDERSVVDDQGKPLGDVPCRGVCAQLYFLDQRRVLVLDGW